jgi:hypothetical protein
LDLGDSVPGILKPIPVCAFTLLHPLKEEQKLELLGRLAVRSSEEVGKGALSSRFAPPTKLQLLPTNQLMK